MSDEKSWAQAPEKIHTYPKMNETIKDLLRRSEEPMNQYILARIEELEGQLKAAVQDIWNFSTGNTCRSCIEWKEGRCSRPGPKDCGGYSWWKWRGFAESKAGTTDESGGQPERKELPYKKVCDDTRAMTMWELAHNCVFIRDGQAWYRDYDREISVLDLMREIIARHWDAEMVSGVSDEELSETLTDNLQFGTDELDGVFAILYRALWGMAEVREWLKESEK